MCVSAHTALESSQQHNEGFPFFTSIQDSLGPRKALGAVLVGCESTRKHRDLQPKSASLLREHFQGSHPPSCYHKKEMFCLPWLTLTMLHREALPKGASTSSLSQHFAPLGQLRPHVCGPEAEPAQGGTAQLQPPRSLLLPLVLRGEQKSAERQVSRL